MQPAGGCVAEREHDQIERREIRVGASRHVVRGHYPLDVADATNRHRAFAVLRGLLRVEAGNCPCWLRNRAEVLGDELECLGLVELARDEQHRVIGLIVVAIERLQPVDRHVLEIGSRSDRRLAVVVPEIRGREDSFQQHIGRTVLARLELVPDDGHLAVEIGLGDERVHHAIRLEVERPAKILVRGRERLEVVRAIEPGGTVRTRAVLGQLLRDVAMAGRPLEHQMLEQVRHAGFAVALMAGADLICHVDRDRLLRLIRKEQDLKAVGQPVLSDAFH